jgi:hypothetical protein
MEIQVEILLDPSGFIRRECPTCEREFKWFHGATEGKPDDFIEPDVYFCPYCGEPSGQDTWWTPAQLEYAQEMAAGPINEYIVGELKSMFKPSRRSEVRVDVSGVSYPETPAPLIDPDDMTMVEPPCHPFEPLKVQDNWEGMLHCLMCGQQFRV